MSVYNAIANIGSNAGAGLNAFAQNRYKIQQDQQTREMQADQNAFTKQKYGDEAKQKHFQQAVQMAAGGADDALILQHLSSMEPVNEGERDFVLGKIRSLAQGGAVPGGSDPAVLQEWRYFSQLPPEEQERYLLMKRGGTMAQLGGGGVGLVNQLDRSVQPIVDPRMATELNARQAGQIAAAQTAERPLGTGFQIGRDPSGAMTASTIPGSQADIDQQTRQQERVAGMEVAARAAQNVFEDVERALELIDEHGRRAAGTAGALTSFISEAPAGRISSHIRSIKGNIAIDSLLAIKRSGAGLGAIPQAQLEALAGLLGEINVRMHPDDLKYNLARIQKEYEDIASKLGGDPRTIYADRIAAMETANKPAPKSEIDKLVNKYGNPQ